MLNSLSKNTDLENTDFHLYLDGWVDRITKKPIGNNLPTLEQRVKLCREAFRATSLPNKFIHDRKEHVHIAINEFEATEDLTSNYEHIVLLEDDIVLSPHYLRLLRVLIDQFKNEDQVFSVSLNFKKLDTNVVTKLNKIKFVTNKECHWWAECFSSNKWKIIKPQFLKYYEIVKNINYTKRPHYKIKNLIESWGVDFGATSQDAAKDASVTYCGLKRVNTVINRGIYIGEYGTHFTPGIYREKQLHLQEPYIFAKDKDLKRFLM